jgi:hypothetical protein
MNACIRAPLPVNREGRINGHQEPPIDASLAQYRELLRDDLQTFIQRGFGQLNPHARLALNWHLLYVVKTCWTS